MIWLTAGWILNVVWSFRMTVGQNRQSVGLPLAVILSTTFLYIGFIAYLNPEYNHARLGGSLYLAFYNFSRETVVLGTLASLLAITSLNCGVFLSNYFAKRSRLNFRPGQLFVDPSFRLSLLIGLALFGTAGFALAQVQIPLPLIDAILQVGRNAAIVVICLGASLVLLSDGKASYGRWIVLSVTLPVAYVVLFGFVSYGFIAMSCILAFFIALGRKKRIRTWQFLLSGLGATYLLLSVFIVWMRFRDSLREMISSDASMAQRFEAIYQAAVSFRFLNWSDLQSLDLLTIRLNQYIFVGKAIELHTANSTMRLWGETIWVSLLAWVPRFLWPGKPEMNTTQFMRDHTGIQFTDRAAFGNGPIMEFYVNFGWAGIIFGFLIFGLCLSRVDRRASISLKSGRILDFIKWFAVGLAFVAPLTSFFFMVNTAIATFAIFSLIQLVIGREQVRSRRTAPVR